MISMTFPQYLRHECMVDGICVHLQQCEADMLVLLLVSDPAGFVSKDTLIEALWPDPDLEPDYALHSIWVRICHLRHKGVPIETAYTFGWRIPAYARSQFGYVIVNESAAEHPASQERLAA